MIIKYVLMIPVLSFSAVISTKYLDRNVSSIQLRSSAEMDHNQGDSVGRVHVPQETVVRDVTAFENALKAPKARKVPVPVSVPVPVPVFGRFLGK